MSNTETKAQQMDRLMAVFATDPEYIREHVVVRPSLTVDARTERDGRRGYHFTNRAGYWVGWVTRNGNGVLMLMSTGAPLTDQEREALAAKMGEVVGERVSAE